MQMEILALLKKVSQRLEMVEYQVAATSHKVAQESRVGSPSGAAKLGTDNVVSS